MGSELKWVGNKLPQTEAKKELALMAPKEIEKVRQFHASFPQYSRTPLASLDKLAASLGVAGIYVKDESYRFGLNAFKVLGGSFAMARFIAQRTGKDISELGFRQLTSPEIKQKLGDYTFFTATDGNHGRGVAWAANQIKQHSVVYMPKGSSQTRLQNILKEGSKASIVDMNYDDAVRLATAESAKTPNSVVIQDTAWKGYEEIPGWIMQGYGTMALEAVEQLRELAVNRPTHIFVQAGVGSLAGAVQGFFANYYPDNVPVTTVVEAGVADCLYRSAVKADGSTVAVGGDLQTIMAGLACGEANSISWEILKSKTSFFVSLPDYAAARAMRVLGAPVQGDPRVVSGESGAAGMGLVLEALTNPAFADLKKALKLDASSRILMFSTEGDTDPDMYKKIVWDGAYPHPTLQ